MVVGHTADNHGHHLAGDQHAAAMVSLASSHHVFLLLALDERFMFHEQLKEQIIFSSYADKLPRWLYEIPVIAGACIGGFMALLLWRNLSLKSRVLLLFAVVMGTASVVIDVLAGGVFWEECLKLVAELLVVCALVMKVEE